MSGIGTKLVLGQVIINNIIRWLVSNWPLCEPFLKFSAWYIEELKLKPNYEFSLYLDELIQKKMYLLPVPGVCENPIDSANLYYQFLPVDCGLSCYSLILDIERLCTLNILQRRYKRTTLPDCLFNKEKSPR